MSKIRLLLLSSLAAILLNVAVSAPAFATEFFNSAGTLITSPLNILGKGTVDAALKATISGVKVTITCVEVHATGSINNASTMGLGAAILALFIGCTVSGAGTGGCLVAKMITLQAHVLAVGTSTAPELEFVPENEPAFVTITLEDCTEQAELNTSLPLTGAANAIVNNTAEEIVFTAASTSDLRFGGNKASLTGRMKVEMEGGGKITVE